MSGIHRGVALAIDNASVATICIMKVIWNGMKMSEEYFWDLWDFIEIFMINFVVGNE